MFDQLRSSNFKRNVVALQVVMCCCAYYHLLENVSANKIPYVVSCEKILKKKNSLIIIINNDVFKVPISKKIQRHCLHKLQ